MTDEQAARNVFDDWHDNKAGTELPRLDQVSLVAAIATALAARERAVWEAAAKLCEHEYDASHDRDAVFYECLLTIAGLCRKQAQGVKP